MLTAFQTFGISQEIGAYYQTFLATSGASDCSFLCEFVRNTNISQYSKVGHILFQDDEHADAVFVQITGEEESVAKRARTLPPKD